MSDIRLWDPVDGNNNDPPPDGFPEGMPAASLNDGSRAVMGGVRRQWEDKEWFEHGHTIAFATATTFTVPTDESAIYHVNRRVKAIGTLTGTIYGKITDVAVATGITVTVAWDSGNLVTEVDGSERVHVGSAVTGKPVPGDGVDITIPTAWEVGDVKLQSHTSIPANWLEASGQAVSRATYAALDALYSADGYPYGNGDGSTTFNLPDLNGRAAIGRGTGTGTTRTLGDSIGAETHQLSASESGVGPHGHDLLKGTAGAANASRAGDWDGAGSPSQQSGVVVNHPGVGASAAHNNMQPSLAMVYVVRVLP